MTGDEAGLFGRVLDRMIEPALERLAGQLVGVSGLAADERAVVVDVAATALPEVLSRKVTRMLVLELNAARLTGRLTAPDAQGRWTEFLDLAADPGYWQELGTHYPQLLSRVDTLVANRCAALAALSTRFAADRAALARLAGTDVGPLNGIRVGAGDSHRGGHTVAIVACANVTVVYKPRPVEVDHRLSLLLAELTGEDPDPIRVPAVLAREGYGWAEFVEHRYCADDAELRTFYRNLGHWLGVMRLLGGTDLHAENLIACGPVPVVVDCETLLAPVPWRPSGCGDATDRVIKQLTGSVLNSGLLPGRGAGLGWRGVDTSAIGGLPSEQPTVVVPNLVGAGTDTARIALRPMAVPRQANHPHERPELNRYWTDIIDGLEAMAERIDRLDRDRELETVLAGFADCVVRVLVRDTESYAELGRMLWHPVGLHDQESARRRACELLATHSLNTGGPAEHRVHVAEVADLLVGDIPVFTTTPADGRMHTPAGTVCGDGEDQIAATIERWRAADLDFERRTTAATLVSAYLEQGWVPTYDRMAPPATGTVDLDIRRRAVAADVVRRITAEAVRGDDGTATWFAPVLDATGWRTTQLPPDLYGGTLGVAVALAGYEREVDAGRADPVDGVAELLAGTLRTARLTQARWAELSGQAARRPDPAGGFIGLASQVWCWLNLHGMGLGEQCIADALFIAEYLPAAIDASEIDDLLLGTAGAIVPLLALADRVDDQRWLKVARQAGERLAARAHRDGDAAFWPDEHNPHGTSGFGHGVSGTGWALGRLAAATGDEDLAALAAAALRHEERWYAHEACGWLDARTPGLTSAAWCNGAVGIGLGVADLLARGAPLPADRLTDVLRRAAESTWRQGFGVTHTLCHGDAGAWELLAAARVAGLSDVDASTVDARMVGSIEEHGAITGMARDAYTPSLMSGQAGIVYQLLRLHPDCDLPSVLLLDDLRSAR